MFKVVKQDINKEKKLQNRYQKLSAILLLIGLLFFILIILVIVGIYFLEMGNEWALLTVHEWMYVGSIVFAFFLALELIFFIHYRSSKGKKPVIEKPVTQYFKDKKLHIFSYPENSKGGIYSKTLIKIDENNVLNVKTQMISPKELLENNE